MKVRNLNEDLDNTIFYDPLRRKAYQYVDGEYVEIKGGDNPPVDPPDDDDDDGDDIDIDIDADVPPGGKPKKGKPKKKGNKSDSSGDNIEVKPDTHNGEEEDDEPMIGDKGDKEFQDKENEERAKKVADEVAAGRNHAESDEETEIRLKKIDDLLKNKKFNDTLADEDKDLITKSRYNKARKEIERQRRKEAKEKNTVTRLSNLGDKAEFKRDLVECIKQQAIMAKRKAGYSKTYSRYNRRSSSLMGTFGGQTPVLRGRRPEPPELPVINFYFDRSGSWDNQEMLTEGNNFRRLLKGFEDEGLIEVHTYYFSDDVSPEDDPHWPSDGGGTRGTPIQDHIEETLPDNVIIMTDRDITDCRRTVSVPGGVFFMFNGSASQNVYDHINGVKFKKAYALSSDWRQNH